MHGSRQADPHLEHVIVLRIELNLILVKIVKQVVGTEDLGNLDELVRVTLTMEERLLAENHRSEHSTQAPHIQAVVVSFMADQQLR